MYANWEKASYFLKKQVVSSLNPSIDLLKGIFTHLELIGQAFDLYVATTEDKFFEFWQCPYCNSHKMYYHQETFENYAIKQPYVNLLSTIARLGITHFKSKNVDNLYVPYVDLCAWIQN